jgi:flavin reductase (DIM6/NTAB) family NADH-FMN oxidoreductase RutF
MEKRGSAPIFKTHTVFTAGDFVTEPTGLIALDTSDSIWERFFTVFPLVVIGTEEPDGALDLAPKHLAMPMSWQNHFGFVCTPRHATYQNVRRTRAFTVTYARPSQAVLASLAASPRCDDGSKPVTGALPTFPAEHVGGGFLSDGYLFLECRLKEIYDDFGVNSLITGDIVAARVAEDALRDADQDDQDLIRGAPLISYLYPGRFAEIASSQQLPFPAGFKR